MTSGLSDAAVRHLGMVADVPDLSHTQYELIEYIAHGGMGAVYVARDRNLDRYVALKVVGTPGGSPDSARRLVTEACILARLEHPSIVPVHHVGALPDGRTFYTMKLVRGRPLDDGAVRSLRISDRLRIFERICDAVGFAHAHQVIHRDLKPANVMVGSFGEVLVMDWGVAKILGSPDPSGSSGAAALAHGIGHTAAGTIVGTPGYMAPEQARGATADEVSDIYALGAILAFLLGMQAPAEVVPEAPAGAERTPRPLKAIVAKALAAEPSKRYQVVEQLAADIARFSGGFAVNAYREGIVEWSFRVIGRYRAPIALVLAYMLMRLALLVLARS